LLVHGSHPRQGAEIRHEIPAGKDHLHVVAPMATKAANDLQLLPYPPKNG